MNKERITVRECLNNVQIKQVEKRMFKHLLDYRVIDLPYSHIRVLAGIIFGNETYNGEVYIYSSDIEKLIKQLEDYM